MFLSEYLGIDFPDIEPTLVVIESPGTVKQTLIAEIEAIQNYAVAEYTGVVFIRDTLPASFIGIDIYDIEVWKYLPGKVTASIDLLLYDLESNISIRSNSVYVCLPEPEIDTVMIIYDEALGGITSVASPLESADEIGMLEDAMFLQAESLLVEEALNAGIQDVARNQAVRNMEAAVNTLCENAVTMVNFDD